MELLTIFLISAPFAVLLLMAYTFSHGMNQQVDEMLLGLRGQIGKVSHRLEKMEAKVDLMERDLRKAKRLNRGKLPQLLLPAPAKALARAEMVDFDETMPGLRNAFKPV